MDTRGRHAFIEHARQFDLHVEEGRFRASNSWIANVIHSRVLCSLLYSLMVSFH